MSRDLAVYNYGENRLECAYWLTNALQFGSTCKITSSQPANFITPIGAYKKQKLIEAKGMPDLKNGRFITLTLDRELCGDPETGYETGKRHLRQFIYELRKALGVTEEDCPHCWKLEFHEDGWAHWHLLFLYRQKLPYSLVDAAWRLGRTETQRVNANRLDYLFKYVTKGGEKLPQYILDRKQVRFWQTSKNFHTLRSPGPVKASPRLKDEDSEKVTSDLNTEKGETRKEFTLGERLIRWLRTISIRIGRHVAIVQIASFPDLIKRGALQANDDLQFGYRPIVLTCISLQMHSNRALEFLENEFTAEIEQLTAA